MNNDSYQVVQVKLSKIRPDPNQPRKIFEKEEIANLANSIKRHGMIKNIEITPNNIIVTGENRYRAAKLLGMKTVPCRIISPKTTGDLRERQLAENLQHISMNPMDIARALGDLKKKNPKASLTDLSHIVGKHRDWVGLHLAMLKFPKSLQASLGSGEMNTMLARSFAPLQLAENRGDVPKGTVEKGVKKVRKEKLVMHGARNLFHRMSDNPEKIDDFLAVDLRGKSESEITLALDRVAPSTQTQARRGAKAQVTFLADANKLKRHLINYPYAELGLKRNEIRASLTSIKALIEKWLP